MDSWLTYSDFKEKYPDSSLTEPQFTPMAIDAALFIENATRWCASIAAEPEQTELLAAAPGTALVPGKGPQMPVPGGWKPTEEQDADDTSQKRSAPAGTV